MQTRRTCWAVFAVAAFAADSGLAWQPPPVTIHDVTVVDVESGTLRPHVTVRVAGARIAAVTPARLGRPPGRNVIDGRGRYLIPGLWDMHSHSLWSKEAMQTFLPLYVANGVTGIRDMGGRLDILAAYRDEFGKGPAWPRVIAAGQVVDGPQPVHADISIPVSDAASAAAAVQSLSRAGADFIKVYTLLPRPAYFAIIAEARRAGLPVAGHVPAAITPEEAALAGQRSIEHLRDEIDPLCSPDALQACAKLSARFRDARTWQVPTLITLRSKAFFGQPAAAADPRLRYIPPELRREWLAGRETRIGRGSAYAEGKRKRYADEAWLTGFFARSGVPILAGTDAGVAFCFPGFSLHDELALLVREAGMTPLDALRSATLAPARYLGKQASMGAIRSGYEADMVLLTGNPLADIAAVRQIEAVLLRGRVLRGNDLDELLTTSVR